MSSVFLERTLELLKNRSKNITYALIEEETGLKQSWLESLNFKRNEGLDPGIRRIETLYNYLNEKPFTFEVNIDSNLEE